MTMKELLEIKKSDLSEPEIVDLLQLHHRRMREVSPPESCHVLNLDELRQPEITVWGAWQTDQLAGCTALKELDASHGEIKSMKVSEALVGKGFANSLLEFLIDEATRRGYRQLSLETGSMDYFTPARNLYLKYGFKECPPFAGYVKDVNSVFMCKRFEGTSE